MSTGTAGQGGTNPRSFYSRNEAQNMDYWPVLSIAYSYDDPRHSTYDLGEFAGHYSQVSLDKGRVEVGTTDLAVASWGPSAALTRSFSTTYQDSRIAPGWVFSFDRHLGPTTPGYSSQLRSRRDLHRRVKREARLRLGRRLLQPAHGHDRLSYHGRLRLDAYLQGPHRSQVRLYRQAAI